MRDWTTMTATEKAEVNTGAYAVKQKMNDCLYTVLALLRGDEPATAAAWKLAWGCYAINTPEEIAAHCREVAV